MLISQREFVVAPSAKNADLLTHFESAVSNNLPVGAIPIRFAITRSDRSGYYCETAALEDIKRDDVSVPSVFEFKKRNAENSERFTTVLVVPTGIGSEIGGHAGDAGPIARLFGSICDRVITHPNVVNASDINELPDNGLYVEGSVLCRLLMGTAGLIPVRSNRVLVLFDATNEEAYVNDSINAVSAARASYGMNCNRVVLLRKALTLKTHYTAAGIAAGEVHGLESVCRILEQYRGEYDAVAISSVIDVPPEFHLQYFQSEGLMVNPWGGVEAMLTHAISSLYNIPSAHAPMIESDEILTMDAGVVDARMAAEAVSVTFLQCVLKGLQRSPKIVSAVDGQNSGNGTITSEDVSCVIIPWGCLGIPTLAALYQGIPVIAVRENANLMRNDLRELPWEPGKFFSAENYWEAAGIVAALKSGIDPMTARRPLKKTFVVEANHRNTEERRKPEQPSSDIARTERIRAR